MDRGKRYVASIFLSAALMVPIGALAISARQDQDDRERHEQQQQRDRRVYDRDNKDYHNWNSQEDQMYRRWLEERRQSYVDYDRLDARQQREYWSWRHTREGNHQGNNEHEEHEHH
jgi:hypothetical protein